MATNDDRMNQVVLVNGTLYGALNSLLRVRHLEHQGIAWFAVQPSLEDSQVRGAVVLVSVGFSGRCAEVRRDYADFMRSEPREPA